MSELLYATDYTVNTVLTGCLYADGKVTLQGLTEIEIAAIKKEKNRVDHRGFNPTDDPDQEGLSTEQLSAILTGLATQEPNDKMAIFSQPQLKWAKRHHPDFMDKELTEE